MNVFKLYIPACVLLCVIAACKQPKAPAQSTDTLKTNVAVAGKTDSVINNPVKKYGNATVAEPCVKCLLQVIRDSKSYKENTANIAASNINYTINWINASAPALPADSSRKANGIRIDVKKDDDGEDTRLCAYVYNNINGTMYLLNSENKYQREISSITPDILKKIRNACYWGVASGK